MTDSCGGGPLRGLRVVELAGIGPGPFAAMLLADLGAEVICIDRPGAPGLEPIPPRFDLLRRGRRSAVIDLRRPEGVAAVLQLVAQADALIESNRPGVAERLGVGPDACFAVNPRLVYGRMTGWGQDGPLATTAGHDITYLARTGALHATGRAGGPPVVPVNFVGDFGGGSLYLVVGLLAAVIEAKRSGIGQVVDAAIVDGSASLTTLLHGLLAAGRWQDSRGVNLLDSGAPWYDVYETAGGGHVAVGALEPKFYAELMNTLGLDPDEGRRSDPALWPRLREELTAVFLTRSRDEWAEIFDGSDACVAPVLSLGEVTADVHMGARGVIAESGGIPQPMPAPRFSRTVTTPPTAPVAPGTHTWQILHEWGVADIEGLLANGVVMQAP